MPTGTTNLMERIYDLLTEAYASTAGGSAFLAFEKLGVPISPGMFKLASGDTALSPPLAVERLSEIANTVLTVQGDSVERTSRSVDDMVEMLLLQAAPLTADQLASFGATRTVAGKNFDSAIGSLEGRFQYHPVYASPVDWYDPAAAGNWTARTIGQQQTATQSPPPAPTPRPVQVAAPNWRVLPMAMQPALAQPIGHANPLLVTAAVKTAAPPPPEPMAAHVMMAARPIPAAAAMAFRAPTAPVTSAPAASDPAPRPFLASAAMQTYRPLMLAQASAQLSAGATTQPVATDSINISFEHCVVTLSRHWFPEVFMLMKSWYLPGYAAGSFSSGKGAGDTGLLPLVATGFVAIRNLRIAANWSADEKTAVQGSAAFGPFSLIGRSYDESSGTLSCPGMQILGWFLEPLPVLPPANDPQLSPSTATATAGSGSAQPGAPSPPAGTTPSDPTASTGSTSSGSPSAGSPQPSQTPVAGPASVSSTTVASNPGG